MPHHPPPTGPPAGEAPGTAVSPVTWGRSSVGRAPPLQGGGQEFEPPRLHHQPRFLQASGTGGRLRTTEHGEHFRPDDARVPRNPISPTTADDQTNRPETSGRFCWVRGSETGERTLAGRPASDADRARGARSWPAVRPEARRRQAPTGRARYQLNRDEERWYFKYRVSDLM